MGFRNRTRIPLRADDVRGPVASAADGIEGEVRGTVVRPAGDALARRPRLAHDELATRVRVREHADVVALYFAVLQDVHLRRRRTKTMSLIGVLLLNMEKRISRAWKKEQLQQLIFCAYNVMSTM